ncbi:DUF2484 family protein [Pseudohalocynthiibacter aestuariivivens]|jgi:Protein of unknown function (DUF2484)|uniref:DUF2484 family protein n=1 Tax=Pseudohalocynthiibacter aestuariivivens TaxID=1591409 RepID=A0ABV5JBN7_9RHOB|nr:MULTISPECIES: DUF2484 family protein [Pseudohalocynthiibacter]MBS9716876.1 DUF2484 family protein [Pseudohalocynthiibacter aestuariivivens]MCK0102031.1 DUF2484 family protein [Pseudohalocynthiibacter sp. F2068]
MNTSLVLTLLWMIIANVSAILPSKDNYWSRAYGLIAIGVPLLGYLTYENGPWVGLIALAAGASMLRWPIVYLGRWLRHLVLGGANDPS